MAGGRKRRRAEPVLVSICGSDFYREISADVEALVPKLTSAIAGAKRRLTYQWEVASSGMEIRVRPIHKELRRDDVVDADSHLARGDDRDENFESIDDFIDDPDVNLEPELNLEPEVSEKPEVNPLNWEPEKEQLAEFFSEEKTFDQHHRLEDFKGFDEEMDRGWVDERIEEKHCHLDLTEVEDRSLSVDQDSEPLIPVLNQKRKGEIFQDAKLVLNVVRDGEEASVLHRLETHAWACKNWKQRRKPLPIFSPMPHVRQIACLWFRGGQGLTLPSLEEISTQMFSNRINKDVGVRNLMKLVAADVVTAQDNGGETLYRLSDSLLDDGSSETASTRQIAKTIASAYDADNVLGFVDEVARVAEDFGRNGPWSLEALRDWNASSEQRSLLEMVTAALVVQGIDGYVPYEHVSTFLEDCFSLKITDRFFSQLKGTLDAGIKLGLFLSEDGAYKVNENLDGVAAIITSMSSLELLELKLPCPRLDVGCRIVALLYSIDPLCSSVYHAKFMTSLSKRFVWKIRIKSPAQRLLGSLVGSNVLRIGLENGKKTYALCDGMFASLERYFSDRDEVGSPENSENPKTDPLADHSYVDQGQKDCLSGNNADQTHEIESDPSIAGGGQTDEHRVLIGCSVNENDPGSEEHFSSHQRTFNPPQCFDVGALSQAKGEGDEFGTNLVKTEFPSTSTIVEREAPSTEPSHQRTFNPSQRFDVGALSQAKGEGDEFGTNLVETEFPSTSTIVEREAPSTEPSHQRTFHPSQRFDVGALSQAKGEGDEFETNLVETEFPSTSTIVQREAPSTELSQSSSLDSPFLPLPSLAQSIASPNAPSLLPPLTSPLAPLFTYPLPHPDPRNFPEAAAYSNANGNFSPSLNFDPRQQT